MHAKGTVEIIATDVTTGKVVQRQVVTNTIVRDGRVALAKLITGEASFDTSYIILDASGTSSNNGFPRVYVQPPSPNIHDSWMGIVNSGIVHMYYLGPKYTADPVINVGLGPVTYDIYGFVTYLNEMFNAYSNYSGFSDIPIYKADGEIFAYVPRTSPGLKASIVDVAGVARVIIQAQYGGTGSIVPYSTTIETESGCLDVSGISGHVAQAPDAIPRVRFQTDDCLFGPGTIMHTSEGVPTGESDFVVNGLQLGTSNGTTNITDSEFVAGTYVSPRYVPTVSYGQTDGARLYDTQAKFKIVIPSSEGNGESGLGVTYTEAALISRNNRWFAHTHFGQFFKSNQIQLTVQWTVDFMP